MILAALVHAGLDVDVMHDVVRRLGLPEVALVTSPVRRGGLAAMHVRVEVGPASRKAHRHLPEILDIIERAGLAAPVAANARRIFERLASAEAAIHGIPPAKVHFHEVGAADAIVDIVGACAGLHALRIDRVVCSPIPIGSGTVTCEHGVLPVPAPATAELLRGVPIAACDVEGELTTPTGAAILTTLAAEYGPPPAMRLEAIGYGAGTREFRARANVLRVMVGTAGEGSEAGEERVVILETQLDDSNPQAVAFACERLLEAGALDVYTTPIGMKKSRPGVLLTALCRAESAAACEDVLFAETTTLGVRRSEATRQVLERTLEQIETPAGPIRVKVGRRGGRAVRAWPEYEDCAAAARRTGTPLRVVQEQALSAWQELNGRRGDGPPG